MRSVNERMCQLGQIFNGERGIQAFVLSKHRKRTFSCVVVDEIMDLIKRIEDDTGIGIGLVWHNKVDLQ